MPTCEGMIMGGPIKGVGLLHGYIIEMIAVTYAYDTAGRLSTVTDWSGRVTTFTYDGQSRLSRMSYPNGTRRTIDYDFAGRVSRRLDEVTSSAPIKGVGLLHGYIIEMIAVIYAYDTAGRLSTVTGLVGPRDDVHLRRPVAVVPREFPQRHPPHDGL
jgi:YD repeat-containing protein